MNIKLDKVIAQKMKEKNIDPKSIKDRVQFFLEETLEFGKDLKSAFQELGADVIDAVEMATRQKRSLPPIEKCVLIESMDKSGQPFAIIVPNAGETCPEVFLGSKQYRENYGLHFSTYGNFLKKTFGHAGFTFSTTLATTRALNKLKKENRLYQVSNINEAINAVDYFSYKTTGKFADFGFSKKGKEIEKEFHDDVLTKDVLLQQAQKHQDSYGVSTQYSFGYQFWGKINSLHVDFKRHKLEQEFCEKCNANRRKIKTQLPYVKPREKFVPYNVEYSEYDNALFARNEKRYEKIEEAIDVVLKAQAGDWGSWTRNDDRFDRAMGEMIVFSDLGYVNIDKTIEQFEKKVIGKYAPTYKNEIQQQKTPEKTKDEGKAL